jgi:glycosyltransferase involved in cell wall biosynthesis
MPCASSGDPPWSLAGGRLLPFSLSETSRVRGEAAVDILFVGALPPLPGGAPISTGRLLAELAGRGHAIRAIAPITPAELAREDAFAACHPEIELRRFLVPAFEIATGSPPSDEYRRQEGAVLLAAAEPLLRARLPDVVVIGRESFAWHVPQIAREWGRPSVLLARGNPTRLILDGTYPPAHAAFFLAQFRTVDLIVTVAEHLADGLRRVGIARVVSIPNAVDLNTFVPRPRSVGLCEALGLLPSARVLVHLSNLTALKRPLDLVGAVAELRPQLPDLRCVVVGDGPLRPAVEETACRLGVSDIVRCTGWIEHERVADYINLADAVVMPSVAEGLARVYLETQACARLLVASDIPAAREVIRHATTGLLFRTGNVPDLIAQIRRAATDPELRDTIGRSARAFVVRRHGIPDMVDAYERVLARLARSPAADATGAHGLRR